MFSSLKRAAPFAILAVSLPLSGCAYLVDDFFDGVDGVALSELDTSGTAPSHIQLAGPDEVIITEGDSWAVTLDGDREAGEALRFDLDGEWLTIGRDRDLFDGSGTAIIRITVPAPSHLAIAGSGSITSPTMSAESAELEIKGSGGIKVERVVTNSMVFDIKGSGDVTVDTLEADEVEVDIKGSGDVRAAGKADKLNVDIKGRGNVALAKLAADEAFVDIKGSGDVKFASDGKVTADIKGSGDIVVTGNATCSQDVKGSGSLRCKPVERRAAKETSDAAAE